MCETCAEHAREFTEAAIGVRNLFATKQACSECSGTMETCVQHVCKPHLMDVFVMLPVGPRFQAMYFVAVRAA